MPDLREFGLRASWPGIGRLFDRCVEDATIALDECGRRATVRIARAADITNGGKRINRLPCDHRRAILETGNDA